MIQKITSINNQLIKDLYRKIHIEHSLKMVVIESFKIIKELRQKNHPIKYVFCSQKWFDSNKTFFDKATTQIIITTHEVINKLSFVKSQMDVILIVEYKLNHFSVKPNEHYVILDEIKDPNNMANIIRTCISFNCINIFISNNSVALTNDKVVRGSMGSIFQVNVNYYDDLAMLIKALKQQKFITIATCLDKQAIKLNEFSLPQNNFAFILGNESKGLDAEIIKLCDYKLFINMCNIDSLNVSSAFAIFAFWLTKDLLWKK